MTGDIHAYEVAARRRAWAHRLMLASIRGDWEAEQMVEEEIGDCAGCWADVASMLAQAAAQGWVYLVGEEAAIDTVAAAVAVALDDLEGEHPSHVFSRPEARACRGH